MNKVTIIGNVTKDIELRQTFDGKNYCRMTVAVSREHGGGTDFIPVTVWEDLAESCAETISKGSRVKVEGRFRTGSYENKEGEKRYTSEVYAYDIGVYGKSGGTEKRSVSILSPEAETRKKQSELAPLSAAEAAGLGM